MSKQRHRGSAAIANATQRYNRCKASDTIAANAAIQSLRAPAWSGSPCKVIDTIEGPIGPNRTQGHIGANACHAHIFLTIDGFDQIFQLTQRLQFLRISYCLGLGFALASAADVAFVLAAAGALL